MDQKMDPRMVQWEVLQVVLKEVLQEVLQEVALEVIMAPRLPLPSDCIISVSPILVVNSCVVLCGDAADTFNLQ